MGTVLIASLSYWQQAIFATSLKDKNTSAGTVQLAPGVGHVNATRNVNTAISGTLQKQDNVHTPALTQETSSDHKCSGFLYRRNLPLLLCSSPITGTTKQSWCSCQGVEKLSDIVDLSVNEIQLQLQYYSHWYIVKRYICCTTAAIWQLHHSQKYP
ncbi:unnamed protein product [Sphagnum balticum]